MKKVAALVLVILTILLLPQFCFAASPAIKSITPTTATAGTIIETITGSNFQGVRSVAVYNSVTKKLVINAAYTTISKTQIKATATLAAGSYYVKINTNTGTSNNSPILTLASPPPPPPPPPAPVISSISPTPASAGTFNETIKGSNFTNVQGVAACDATTGNVVSNPSFTVNSSSQITAAANLAAGSYFLRVTSTSGASNNSPTLTVLPPPPVISSIAPTSATAGTFNQTISGSNFTNVKGVAVHDATTGNLVSNPGFTVNSSSQMTAAVNLAAGSYSISVASASGTSNNSPTLQVVAPTPPPPPPPPPSPSPSPPPTPDPSLTPSNTPGSSWLGSAGYSTMAAAVISMGNAKQTLFVPAGVFEVSSNLTIPSNISLEVLQGAIILIDPGVTLNIQGPFTAGPYQIFTDNSGDLTKGVKFALSCALSSVSPEWWGAVADDSTDCASAINLALNAGAGCVIPVQFGAGTYMCSNSINLNASVALLGAAGGGTILTTPSNVSWSLITSSSNVTFSSLQNLTFLAGSGCSGKLLNIDGHYNVIRNCTFNTSGYPTDGLSWALYISSTKSKVHDNTFTGNAGVWFGSMDGWFYANQISGPGYGVANSLGLMNGNGPVDSNTVSGWATGVLMDYSSFIYTMFDNNSVSQCVYALKGGGFDLINDEAGASGFITNNTVFSNTYGYICASSYDLAKITPQFGVVMIGNTFYNNNIGTGPETLANAAILENDGHHIITGNMFQSNANNLAGTGNDLVYNNVAN